MNAFRERDVGYREDVSDIQACKVTDNFLRDVSSSHDQFDFAADNGKHAAALQTRREFFVDELDGNEQIDFAGSIEPHEVHVARQILHDVPLN